MSRRAKVWPLRSPCGSEVIADPYSPTSKGFAERGQETEVRTVTAPHMRRVDVGSPVPRLEGEPQPVRCGKPKARPAAPKVAPAPAPAAPAKAPRKPEPHRALGKPSRPE
jgi:hypothetical protein